MGLIGRETKTNVARVSSREYESGLDKGKMGRSACSEEVARG